MNPLSDEKIVESWHKNALPWTEAVRLRQIQSRRLVTDRAIVDAVLGRSPQSVLDLGCGEGWLARELSTHGVRVTGTDVIPTLIERAREAGRGEFHVKSYADIAAGKFKILVDTIVCNFSLLGKESVEGIFGAAHDFVGDGGSFIVQTIHPVVACGSLPYQDGWRTGSWDGFGCAFTDPAPWYFRTLESWRTLFLSSRFRLLEMREPLHPVTQQPASAVFIAERMS